MAKQPGRVGYNFGPAGGQCEQIIQYGSVVARDGSSWEVTLMTARNSIEALRVARVRLAFAENFKNRAEGNVLLFYGWLQQYQPHLLQSPKHGDPYQSLKVDLSGLYK
jgi:hypothetical protein